jgi:hypothetical protein
MKKVILIISVLFTFELAIGQNNQEVDSLIKKWVLNYAVPDLPALNALSMESSSLLRPSTPRDFAVATSQFFDGNSIIIPKSIALEFAPIVLFDYNKLTLQSYQKMPILYNSRISLATFRDSINISKIAIGYRTTLINKGDIKSDKNITQVYRFLENINDERNNFINQQLDSMKISLYQYANDPELQKKLMEKFDMLIKVKKDSMYTAIKEYKEKVLWNKEKLDIAFSLVFSSFDTLMKNIQYNSFLFWASYGIPISNNGQFVIGIHTNLYNFEGKNQIKLAIPARFYLGSNTFKSYLEGEYQYLQQNKSNNLLMRLGLEYNLYSGFWVDFNAGFYQNFTTNTNRLITSCKIIYALPEK